jgi:acyl-CoA synthetase (AMP-forming)/AMP-acid ligase II
VEDVAVFGVADDEWGEAVASAVVLKADEKASEAELQDWVRKRLRSTYAPSIVHFLDELPYNETGKLLRRVLKEQLASGW